MIDHSLKCIFIHIPASGGSIIEKSLCGKDWQKIDPQTKHLDDTLCKIYYKKYWNEYFKFAFVRNPFDWIVSMYSKTKKEGLKDISFEDYIHLYSKFMYMSWEYPLNRIQIPFNANLEEMDFIGKFENIEKDFKKVCKKLKIDKELLKEKIHVNNRDKDYRKYYDEKTRALVETIFWKDLEQFKYKF